MLTDMLPLLAKRATSLPTRATSSLSPSQCMKVRGKPASIQAQQKAGLLPVPLGSCACGWKTTALATASGRLVVAM